MGAPRLRWYDGVIARPRTIALATIEYPPDPLSAGIGSYVRTLARFLRDAGHQVHVVARAYAPARGEDDGEDDEQGITVHRVGPVRPDLPAGFEGVRTISFALRAAMGEWRYRRDVARTLERLVDHAGVELIEAADHLAEPIFYRPTRRAQVPFVVRLHTPLAFTEMLDPHLPGYARRVVGAIERAFIVRASHVSAPTRTAATAIRGVMRLDDVPIHVHANPVRFPEPSTQPGDDAPERPTVLFVGRVCRLKGVHLLARALPDIVERVPDVRFDLVGSDHVPMDGHPDTRSWLLARLPERYHRHLRFHGHVPPGELGAIYRGATVCAFPSLFESFSYVCLEAMIHGKPVVGSSRGGMAELLDGGRAGVLVDPTEVDALAEAISGLLLDPERRRTLGDRARRRALESYGPERVIRDIETFYERAIDELA